MRPRFQADEDFNAKIISGVLRREPGIDFQTASKARLLGLKDLEVLAAAARSGRILVSHDRRTLPNDFDVFTRNTQSAGLLIVSQKLDIATAIEQIILIWAASEDHEWKNRRIHLPL